MSKITNIDAKPLTLGGMTAYMQIIANVLFQTKQTNPALYSSLYKQFETLAKTAGEGGWLSDLEEQDKLTVLRLHDILDIYIDTYENQVK